MNKSLNSLTVSGASLSLSLSLSPFLNSGIFAGDLESGEDLYSLVYNYSRGGFD